MSILSIDVGIKNLALCLLSLEKRILLWEVLNISCNDPPESQHLSGAVDLKVKCSLCKNNAKYRKNETLFCLRHAKESAFQLPTHDLHPSRLGKMKLPELQEVVEIHSLDATTLEKTKKRKADYLAVIAENILDPLDEASTAKKTKASEISLVEIARIMTTKLDQLLENHLDNIEKVIIENQISPIATRMTSIQGMLTQYFIMKKPTQLIEYISAKNKLKEFDVEKDCYADRKKSGIEVCRTQLSDASLCNSDWTEFFLKHKKKDDLADCYLQGVWYLGQHAPAPATTPIAPNEESI
jgi:hypothetical protein